MKKSLNIIFRIAFSNGHSSINMKRILKQNNNNLNICSNKNSTNNIFTK